MHHESDTSLPSGLSPVTTLCDHTLHPKNAQDWMGQAMLLESLVNLLHRLEQVQQTMEGSPSCSSM